MTALTAFGIGRSFTWPFESVTPRNRAGPTCSQTPTGGRKPSRSEREAEIAAKIESLRRQQKLKSQSAARAAAAAGENPQDTVPEGEGLFMSDIKEGEAFFGTGPAQKIAEKDTTSEYQPRVSTWGVFPRPENISRAYGGGRKLPLGGGEQSAKSREKDARIREKLARYLGGSVAEAEREAEHAEEIEDALQVAQEAMSSGQAFDAARVLRVVLEFANARSRRGGEVRLALALAYEETGRRSEARQIYAELVRLNRFAEIKRTAQRLGAGFDAMEKLRVEDGMGDGVPGFRSEDFCIPDIAALSEKRYATVVREGSDRTAGSRDGDAKESGEDKVQEAVVGLAVLAALAGIPVLAVTFLRSRL